MIYLLITIIILVATLSWACYEIYSRSIKMNKLEKKHNKYISFHDNKIEEKDEKISDLISDKSELDRGLQHAWEIVKQHPKYEKFRGKGAELSLIITGILTELEKESVELGAKRQGINTYTKLIKELRAKNNALKSVINRRDKRIKNLLNKKNKKGVK